MAEEISFLRNLWYMAGLSHSLKAGTMRRHMLWAEPVLIGRLLDGTAFALRDICPHRAAPLSAGRMREGEVECPYHGWRFRPDGVCAAIPSVLQDQNIEVDRIKVQSYPLREQDGLIWIYLAADPKSEAAPALEPPRIPLAGDGKAKPRLIEAQVFPCELDHAVVGLMDPAHGPFVHKAWWWRSESAIHEKAKRHIPTTRGFAMAEHKPSLNSFGYSLLAKLFGGDVSTEIRFELPGVRFEHIRLGKEQVVGFTSVTPQDHAHTLVTQVFYWTVPWFDLVRPLFRPFAREFLAQDRRIVELQSEGLKFDPPQMLIQDADVPALWYFRLKKAWAESVASGVPFENPVQERVLRWRS